MLISTLWAFKEKKKSCFGNLQRFFLHFFTFSTCQILHVLTRLSRADCIILVQSEVEFVLATLINDSY